ncbi:MAG TPA: cyclodeaminase/cyclohydrolase family protein [Chloroflexia bacterium]|nr:cyclodeaminase/cyclohydrolase family protein [Chloroflexia bacterium]
MSLTKLTVEDFIGELATANPTPGGGSASALVGAMAAGMVEMACNLTVGREKFQDVEAELQTVLSRARDLRLSMLAAVNEDTRAYDAVSQAYKLPKTSEEEKTERTTAIQSALQYATEVPLRVAKAASEAGQLAVVAVEKSNPNVASDARVARLLADAARDGAIANVEINLGSIKDSDFVARMREELDVLPR